MTLLQAILLGLVEGLTEFLPISSTGHLIIFSRFLAIATTPIVTSFLVFIQLGAILAVASMYVQSLIAKPARLRAIAIAFLPTGLVGFLVYPLVKHYFLSNIPLTAAALFVGGIILLGIDRWMPKRPTQSLDTLSLNKLLLIGSAQSVSIIPGVSRAAATIIGGLGVGLSREEAVEFSFLLAIPTMAVATGYDLLKTRGALSPDSLPLFAIGFVAAFVSAWIAVKYFLSYIKHHTFVPFGIYRIALAILVFFLVG